MNWQLVVEELRAELHSIPNGFTFHPASGEPIPTPFLDDIREAVRTLKVPRERILLSSWNTPRGTTSATPVLNQ
jgi:hypothetical protein